MFFAPGDKCHDGWHERLACGGQRILYAGRDFGIDLAMHQMALLQIHLLPPFILPEFKWRETRLLLEIAAEVGHVVIVHLMGDFCHRLTRRQQLPLDVHKGTILYGSLC